jgi:hypothetical protein
MVYCFVCLFTQHNRVFRPENYTLCSDRHSEEELFTSLTWKFGGRKTTSPERRLRLNSGSRRVAHCFYPQYVRKLVGVSSTDLRRDGPVLRGAQWRHCELRHLRQSWSKSNPIFCVLHTGNLTDSNSKYVIVVNFF